MDKNPGKEDIVKEVLNHWVPEAQLPEGENQGDHGKCDERVVWPRKAKAGQSAEAQAFNEHNAKPAIIIIIFLSI